MASRVTNFLEWLSDAAVLVGPIIAAVLIGGWQVRTSNPKRRLVYEWRSTPLLAVDSAQSGIEVQVNQTTLKDPYLVHLRIWSDSRADIPSSCFDQNRPLSLDFDTPPLKIVDSQNSSILIGPNVKSPASGLCVLPGLIKKTDLSTVSFITEGQPNRFEHSDSLTDIDVVEAPKAASTPGVRYVLYNFPLLAVMLAMSSAALAMQLSEVRTFWHVMVLILIWAILSVGALVVIFWRAHKRGRRDRSALFMGPSV